MSAEPPVMIVASLEEMAAARERGRQQLAEMDAHVARLRAPYDAAVKERTRLRKALDLVEAAMETSRRQYLIERALSERGFETEDPPVVLARAWVGERAPRRYEIVAVSAGGVALYLYRPPRSHRYEGQAWAVLAEHVPAGATDGDRPGIERRTDRSEEEAGLAAWETRGRGDFGEGSGSAKQKPPPDGGRWRWLRVREQEELPA